MPPQQRLLAGAMSGTSADGVDVALVRITGRGQEMAAQLLRHHHRPYDPALRAAIFHLRDRGEASLQEFAGIGRNISLTYAAAINEALSAAGLGGNDLSAVAAHGQTLYHDPPDTIQWFDPALVAAEVGCLVVSDFRRADCAAGGQGAPLVPFADYALFHSPDKTRVLLNLGGIANITYLPAGAALDQLIAFDTGPANCLSDWLMREMHPGGSGFDKDGALASHGTPDEALALRVLVGDFFKKRPPKSTDGPAMIELYWEAAGDLGRTGKLPNHLATACLTAATAITRAMREFLPQFPDEVIASGGGTHNRTLMAILQNQLAGVPLRRIDELGVPTDAKEAIAFALLGCATLDGIPANVPACTGARRAVVLGSITPKP